MNNNYLLSATLVVLTTLDIFTAPDRDFLDGASRANITEISAAKIAISRSKDSFVVSFARQMMKEHSLAQQELTVLAQKEDVILATTPDTEHKDMLRQLANVKREQFDSLYIQIQRLDHEVTIRLFDNQVSQGKDPAAKAYAQKFSPAIHHHLDMLNKHRE